MEYLEITFYKDHNDSISPRQQLLLIELHIPIQEFVKNLNVALGNIKTESKGEVVLRNSLLDITENEG